MIHLFYKLRNAGATLVETVVLVAITVAVLVALVNLFFIFNTIFGYQQAFMATAGSAGASLNALEASVLPAEHVLASRNFSGTTYSSATSTLVLELPTVDNEGDIVSGAKDYVVFYASSTELYRLVEANGASARKSGRTLLSSTLSFLSFTYDNANFAQVTRVVAEIETGRQFKEDVIQSTLRGEWHLRNLPL